MKGKKLDGREYRFEDTRIFDYPLEVTDCTQCGEYNRLCVIDDRMAHEDSLCRKCIEETLHLYEVKLRAFHAHEKGELQDK